MKAVQDHTPRRAWIVVSILALLGGLYSFVHMIDENWSNLPFTSLLQQAKFKVQSVIADGSSKPMPVDAQTVLKQLESDSDIERLASLEKIQQRCTHQWAREVLPALINVVEKDEEPEVRYQAVVAITAFSGLARDAKPAMLYALGDSSGRIRTAAATFLVTFGKEVRGELEQQLNSSDPRRCSAAALALSHYESTRINQAMPRLITLGKHEDEVIRQHVAIALGHTAGIGALPLLKQLMTDPVDQVRAKAVDSMGLLTRQPQQALDTLKPMLKDESPIVRKSALKALGHLPPEDTVVATITEHGKQEQDPEMCVLIRRTCDRLEFLKQQEFQRSSPHP